MHSPDGLPLFDATCGGSICSQNDRDTAAIQEEDVIVLLSVRMHHDWNYLACARLQKSQSHSATENLF